MRGRGATAIAVTAGLALALAAPAAGKKSEGELGKLKTGTATVSTQGPATFTAVAECPKGTSVVGGGFSAQGPTSSERLNPIESRRQGRKAWRVSAYRIDQAAVGPTLSLTAEAYCRRGLGKIIEQSETVSIVDENDGAPVATCALGKAAVSGGFSIGGPVTPNTLHTALYDNLMAGRVGWVMRAANLVIPPARNTFTSHVYCQRRGGKGLKTVSGAGTTPAAPFTFGTADTAACPGNRNAFAGGFQVPPRTGGPQVLVTESRHTGKGWHVVASRIGGIPEAAPIVAYGYCS
jgi:hypothetical protein